MELQDEMCYLSRFLTFTISSEILQNDLKFKENMGKGNCSMFAIKQKLFNAVRIRLYMHKM